MGGDGASGGGAPATTTGTGGADPEPKIILSGLDSPEFLECDGTHLYWINKQSGDVTQASLDGTAVKTLVAGAVAGAIDSEIDGQYLYYAIGGDSSRVSRIPTAGGATRVIAQDQGILGLSVHAGAPYWFNSKNILASSGLVHTSTTAIVDIAVDDSGVYFADGGAVYVVTNGGMPRRLAAAGRISTRTMLLDAEYVIWGTDDSLERVTKGVGFPETIATHGVNALAYESGTYAWMTSTEVYSRSDDNEPRAVAPANGVGGIALCGGFMFWASYADGVIVRAVP